VRDGVAENASVDALLEGFDDSGGRLEVHVGDPERIKVGEFIPFKRASAASVMDGVERRHYGVVVRFFSQKLQDFLEWGFIFVSVRAGRLLVMGRLFFYCF